MKYLIIFLLLSLPVCCKSKPEVPKLQIIDMTGVASKDVFKQVSIGDSIREVLYVDEKGKLVVIDSLSSIKQLIKLVRYNFKPVVIKYDNDTTLEKYYPGDTITLHREDGTTGDYHYLKFKQQ